METNNTVSDPIVATLLYLERLDDANLRGAIVSLRKKLQSAVSATVSATVSASTEEAAVSLSATTMAATTTMATRTGPSTVEQASVSLSATTIATTTAMTAGQAAVSAMDSSVTPPLVAPAPPPSIAYTRKTRPPDRELIDIDEDCFDVKKNGKERLSAESGKQAKRRLVRKIVDAVLDKSTTPKQQVLALREAKKHPKIRTICKSAGIVDIEQHEICK